MIARSAGHHDRPVSNDRWTPPRVLRRALPGWTTRSNSASIGGLSSNGVGLNGKPQHGAGGPLSVGLSSKWFRYIRSTFLTTSVRDVPGRLGVHASRSLKATARPFPSLGTHPLEAGHDVGCGRADSSGAERFPAARHVE